MVQTNPFLNGGYVIASLPAALSTPNPGAIGFPLSLSRKECRIEAQGAVSLSLNYRRTRMHGHRSLCWLRRDLRLRDSAPLAEASERGDQMAVAFVWDEGILSSIKDRKNRRVSFIHASLEELDQKLRASGSRLIVRRGDPIEEIPKLAVELKAESVVWSEDYDPGPMERDRGVASALVNQGIESTAVKDSVVFHPNEVMTAGQSPFKVYSPYARAWKALFRQGVHDSVHTIDLSKLVPEPQLPKSVSDWSLNALGFDQVELWLQPGEEAAQRRLSEFRSLIKDYATARDFPAADKTSKLSVDFRFGTLSIRDAVRLALGETGEGSEKWLNELIWREFYRHILFHFPHVVESPFQSEFDCLNYPGTQEDWERWRDGTTGFPIVDAAMRCLNTIGYMHNRLRMVTASFLSKDLLLDYRQGEAWFAKQLLDYELASNNGGWQWASSVGCDPQPYFRIFNPILQSKKFDPDGIFIKKWIPELRELEGTHVHFPSEASEMELAAAGVELGRTYPLPCVDHKVQRERAIALLERAKRDASGTKR